MHIISVVLLSILMVPPVHSTDALRFSGIEGSINHMIGTAILVKAYKKIGIDIHTVGFPAKRSLVMSNAGDFDGEVQRVDNMSRHYPNLIKVPEPLLFLESSVFVKNSEIRISKWDQLSSYLIGIPRGIMYLDHHTQGMNRVFVNNLDQLFHLLDIGRIDVVIISTNYGRSFLKKRAHMQIRMLEPPILKIPLFHYLHQQHKMLIPKISESIKQMRDNGKIDEILAQIARPN